PTRRPSPSPTQYGGRPVRLPRWFQSPRARPRPAAPDDILRCAFPLQHPLARTGADARAPDSVTDFDVEIKRMRISENGVKELSKSEGGDGGKKYSNGLHLSMLEEIHSQQRIA